VIRLTVIRLAAVGLAVASALSAALLIQPGPGRKPKKIELM